MNLTPSLDHLLSEINNLSARVNFLEKKVSVLETENRQLKKENEELRRENTLLRRENDRLKRDNDQLRKENTALKEALKKVLTRKDSNNSHLPPSVDFSRKNKSLRGKSNRNRGGQPGHEGTSLKMVAHPDGIRDHIAHYCRQCGSDLEGCPAELTGSRQSVEIPPIKPVVTQHNIYRRVCRCGCENETSFPDDVTAPVSYGSSVSGLAAYLHTRGYIPYQRMKEFFRDVTSTSLSTGTLRNMISKAEDKALPFYREIKRRIELSAVVGADETSVKTAGSKGWMWTWQNDRLTFIGYSDNRGYRTVEKHFENGFPGSVLVHDRYAAHFKTEAAAHQICLVHLRRDLKYLDDLYRSGCSWVRDFRELIRATCSLKKKMSVEDYYNPGGRRKELEDKLLRLLEEKINPKFKEVISLQKNLNKHYDNILTFLYHPEVPPDNNGSERAIRNVKVKQKVSGLFRSGQGAEDFAILRSITDTAIKSGRNILEALILICKLSTEKSYY